MKWLPGLRISRWAGIAIQLVMFPAVHALVPWALSHVGSRHGWVGDRPSFWNLAGLVPIAVGFYIFILCTREHFRAAPKGWLVERTPHCPTPAYLLTGGPYRYSCNPIYMAELVIWLGWIVLCGSLVLAAIFVAAAVIVGPVIVPREERGLDVRFGEVYREFRRTTPRWLGKQRR
jgi:protein-S-isoprenylcysteine O-methyltransferase Ste14